MKFLKIVSLVVIVLVLPNCALIEDGEIGTKITLGEYADTTYTGITVYDHLISSMNVYNVKEVPMELEDLQPKAGDDLSLREFDVTVYFQPNATKTVENLIKYKGSATRFGGGLKTVGLSIAFKEARSAVYDAIGEVSSMTIHKNRTSIASSIKEKANVSLSSDIGVITRVVIRKALPDESIELDIQNAIKLEKQLEAKTTEREIAIKDASIEVERAVGIKKANDIINKSLTPAYLQHEYNQALMEAAKRGNITIVTGVSATQLLGSK